MDRDHPLNMLAAEFVRSYVAYYNEKIEKNLQEFYQTHVNEYQIT